MKKITMELMPKEAEKLAGQLIERLEPAAKLRLAEKLNRETRQARWAALVSKMRQRFAKQPLSSREIRRLCEQVRQERFDRAARRS